MNEMKSKSKSGKTQKLICSFRLRQKGPPTHQSIPIEEQAGLVLNR